MRRRWIALIAVGALLSPVGVVFATHTLADALGVQLGRMAAASLGPIQRAARGSSESSPLEPTPQQDTVPAEVAPESPGEAAASPEAVRQGERRRRRGQPRAATAARVHGGVRVSAQQVLALAARRAVPQAVPVPAQGERPAGLRLVGVSALGVGMRDGDILTRVAGAPVTSAGAVVEIVLRARAKQAREISAEFWRDGARWALVVEQPYLNQAEPHAAPKAPSPSQPEPLAAVRPAAP